jgi:hypothetical protein
MHGLPAQFAQLRSMQTLDAAAFYISFFAAINIMRRARARDEAAYCMPHHGVYV